MLTLVVLLLLFGVGIYVLLSWVALSLMDRLERWSTGVDRRSRP